MSEVNETVNESNELVETVVNEVVTVEAQEDWGDVVVESKDFIMARVVLVQASSEIVKERKAFSGDFWNTLEERVVSTDGSVKLLPFFCRQMYVTERFDNVANKYVYKSQESYKGEQKPFEEIVDGVKLRHLHTYDFFCMTPELSMPVIVSFKSSSHKAGKRLFNLMYVMNKALKLAPVNNWISFGSDLESKNGNTFGVINFKKDVEVNSDEKNECLKWISVIRNTNIKASEDVSESFDQPQTPTNTRF